jgi:hypothetical protein
MKMTNNDIDADIEINNDTDSSDFIDTAPESISPDSTSSPAVGVAMTAAGLDDPVVSALTKRAADLSLSIVNPKTLASKLRESLVEIAGNSSVSYHIGLGFDSSTGQIKAEISKLTPHFVAKISASRDTVDLGIAYQINRNGWDIAVGLTASKSFKKPKGSGVVASFAITISK